MSYTLDLSKIRKACKFTLEVDEDKGKLILKGVCSIKDEAGKRHVFKNEVDLVPMVRTILDRVRESGAITAGPLSLTIEHAGGWLSDTYGRAVGIATKVAENRIAQDIYRDVLPSVAPFVPGGSTALAIANKAAHIVSEAHDGVPAAVAKVHHIAEIAQSSDPAAQLLKVMSVMSRMMQAKRMHASYEDHVGWPWGDRHRNRRHTGWGHHPQTGRPVPRRKAAPHQADLRDHRQLALADAPTPDPYVHPIPGEGDPYEEGYEAAVQEYYESLKKGSEDGAQVEGWLYNRPYRDPVTAMKQITHDPATIHRWLYNRGMGR